MQSRGGCARPDEPPTGPEFYLISLDIQPLAWLHSARWIYVVIVVFSCSRRWSSARIRRERPTNDGRGTTTRQRRAANREANVDAVARDVVLLISGPLAAAAAVVVVLVVLVGAARGRPRRWLAASLLIILFYSLNFGSSFAAISCSPRATDLARVHNKTQTESSAIMTIMIIRVLHNDIDAGLPVLVVCPSFLLCCCRCLQAAWSTQWFQLSSVAPNVVPTVALTVAQKTHRPAHMCLNARPRSLHCFLVKPGVCFVVFAFQLVAAADICLALEAGR